MPARGWEGRLSPIDRSGADGIAGEWGHNPLPWPRPEEWAGPDCYCCRTGCAETFLSGPGLARSHLELGGPDLAPEAIARCVFSDAVRARIVPPAHGDSSGVRGAAWLWSEEESGG